MFSAVLLVVVDPMTRGRRAFPCLPPTLPIRVQTRTAPFFSLSLAATAPLDKLAELCCETNLSYFLVSGTHARRTTGKAKRGQHTAAVRMAARPFRYLNLGHECMPCAMHASSIDCRAIAGRLAAARVNAAVDPPTASWSALRRRCRPRKVVKQCSVPSCICGRPVPPTFREHVLSSICQFRVVVTESIACLRPRSLHLLLPPRLDRCGGASSMSIGCCDWQCHPH